MTRDVAIGIACRLQALVSHTKQEYRDPNDCFCKTHGDPSLYRNSHQSLRFIFYAVQEKLQREGLTPDDGIVREIDAMLDGRCEEL